MQTPRATLSETLTPQTNRAVAATSEDIPEPQHTFAQSVILHLGPGVMITAFYMMAALLGSTG